MHKERGDLRAFLTTDGHRYTQMPEGLRASLNRADPSYRNEVFFVLAG